MPVDHEHTSTDEPVVAGRPVVVRRHAGVAALVGLSASTMAIAYLWRASQTGSPLDWVLCTVMAVVGAVYLSWLVDARTPLLVADDLGVRIRLGHEWRGLPWEAIGQVVVTPRRGPLRDGRLVFSPRSLARALEGLDARARRHVAWNQKMYGAALAVPLGLNTQLSRSGDLTVTEQIAALALDRVEVVEVEDAPEASEAQGAGPRQDVPDESPRHDVQAPGPVERPAQGLVEDEKPRSGSLMPPPGAEADPFFRQATAPAAPAPRPEAEASRDVGPAKGPRPLGHSILGGIGTIVSRVAKGRDHDVDVVPTAPEPSPAEDRPAVAGARAVPLRETRPGLRAEVTRDLPSAYNPGTHGSAALADPAEHESGQGSLPEGRELRRPGSVDLVFEPAGGARVRPIATLGDAVEPLVIDDFVTEPAYDPVIGPELTAARTRLGLSVDELAERTRIRPHVIESIEVDDFAPCGGDFYARGHLRTLARILGVRVEPLLERFEERYATAPVNARRVFEAELATGMTGSMRSTVGGPSWGLLVGAVLCLALVWGAVRLVTGPPAEMVEIPAPSLDGSAGIGADVVPGPPAAKAAPVVKPVPVVLTAAEADSMVVVRDAEGRVVFRGELVLGERKALDVAVPVTVRAADGGAVQARVAGRDRGFLGKLGEPARRTFR